MSRIRHDAPLEKEPPAKQDAAERVESAEKAVEPADSLTKIPEPEDESSFEDLFEEKTEPELTPVFGGRVNMYTYRGFLDETVSQMVRLSPFGGGDQERALFVVTDSTHRRIELKLTERTVRANGKRITSLDFIEHWSNLLKNNPAQGLALFRNVHGVQAFIDGKEPLVKGFNAFDEQTIRIRLERPDPYLFKRLNSSKLVLGSFMLGGYYFTDIKDNHIKLLPNENSISQRPYLREWGIQLGGDSDITQSFSLGMYGAMIIYQQADLEIARTRLNEKTTLHELPSDRYFLSCISEDPQVRAFVRSVVNGEELLRNIVKAEGKEIYSVSTQKDNLDKPNRSARQTPQASAPLRIAYRIDDPVSKIIAEKLSEDFDQKGLETELKGETGEGYERMLVRKEYDCAVGWVSETILNNPAEQLHLATMWFSDEMDLQLRLRENKEIPLFSMNNYLLLRDDVKLYNGKLSGIWVRE
jgi:hypothetical protein